MGLKGKRQVCGLQAAERGCLITVVTCMDAAGGFVPPLIVFPRKNMKPELINGMPPGSIYACHPSGWIQTDIFTRWFLHFIDYTKPSEKDPVLLVLDDHTSHTRNLKVIKLAREQYVSIICIPPHAMHKMQPLDIAFMSPLKTYCAQAIERWLRTNVGRIVTIYQVGELFGKAQLEAATAETAVNGFRKTGLFPCNRHIFTDYDFPFHPEQHLDHSEKETFKDRSLNDLPGTSRMWSKDIMPVPVLGSVAENSRSRAHSAQVITSSPYKERLEIAQTKRKEAEKKTKRELRRKINRV